MKKVFLMLFATMTLAGNVSAAEMVYCSDKLDTCLNYCSEADKYSCQINCWAKKENCDQEEAIPMQSVNFNYDKVVVHIRF